MNKLIFKIGVISCVILVLAFISSAIYFSIKISEKPKEVLVKEYIQTYQTIYAMASYEIHYNGKVYVNKQEKIASFIPSGYSARYDYEAKLLIGTKQFPKILFDNGTVELDFTNVKLEVLAFMPTNLEYVKSETRGWRWFIGAGIPIQEGIFDPIMEAIKTMPSILTENEYVQEKAMNSLIENYVKVYSMIYCDVKVIR